MERFLLFIREPGTCDVTDIHSSEASARTALADYARARGGDEIASGPIEDDIAIAAYFDNSEAVYAIARVAFNSQHADAERCLS